MNNKSGKIIFLIFKSLLFSVLIPGSVAVLIPLLISENDSQGLCSIYSGSFLLATGLVIYCWCMWDFVLTGRGTPAPIDAPKYLVVRGLYHYTRNPMYIAVLLAILGWAWFFSDTLLLAYWICVAICFQLFVVFYEEPRLKQLFAEEYSRYLASVNRWVPGF